MTEFHIDNLIKIIDLGFEVIPIALIPSNISLLSERLKKHRLTEDYAEIERRLESTVFEIQAIKQHRSLFLAVIEVSKDTERDIARWVLEILEPILSKKKGGKT